MEDRFLPLNRAQLLHTLESGGFKRWWVAEFSGVHKTTLRRWLSGGIRRIRPENVARLASALEVPPESLVGRTGSDHS